MCVLQHILSVVMQAHLLCKQTSMDKKKVFVTHVQVMKKDLGMKDEKRRKERESERRQKEKENNKAG